MDERRVADYFVVAGLPDARSPLEDFSRDGVVLKSTYNQAPITDLAVIFPSLGEEKPDCFTQVWTTPTGHPANLNHGSLRSPSVFLCYRRGWDRLPLVDIGVYNESGKENVMSDVEVVTNSPYGREANVNNSNSSRVFITYRRAMNTDPCNILVVTDICIILENKGEKPPHTFCKIPSSLNKGLLGSDVFLCYKKSMNRVNSLSYKPELLARFPLLNHDNFPLPESVPLFCLPMGANVECWPETADQPPHVFSTFVLTVFVSDSVEKVYGTAVTFYESYSALKLQSEECSKLGLVNSSTSEVKRIVHVNKCLCILSRWPFFDTFHKFLEYLHLMAVADDHVIPIERYISHFMQEVPFPSCERPRILIQLDAHNVITLAQLEDSPLPLSGASFKELLKNLGPHNCMVVLLYALTEQKILLHSLRPDVLTSVAEAISMFIFPFHWQCPYIPLCPLGLSDVLSAPMPFIVGVHSRYFDLYDPPADVFCIDLDTVVTSTCEERKSLNVKLLPKKPACLLHNTLGHLFEKLRKAPVTKLPVKQISGVDVPIDLDFRMKKKECFMDMEIQEAFLRFMATILKDFRRYLLPITRAPTIGTTDPNSLFDIHGFLKSREKSYYRFYSLLMRTQMFTRFIEERSFVTDKDASLTFFDECTEKVEAISNGVQNNFSLLQTDDLYQSERTVFIPLPDTNGLPTRKSYSYAGVLHLDPSLYHIKECKTTLPVSYRTSPSLNSPLARRTKQEIRSAQKLAKKQAEDPDQWAKCLLSYSYSLWFIHLPAFVKESRSKSEALGIAFKILLRMQVSHLKNIDEVCYRVLMQLCGQYGEPILAIKIYSNMKNNGVLPNAITYGYYNKAVLENKWPSSNHRRGILWTKLRNVILGAAQFRQVLNRNKAHPLSSCTESNAASWKYGVPVNKNVTTPLKICDDSVDSSVELLFPGHRGCDDVFLDTFEDSFKDVKSLCRLRRHKSVDLGKVTSTSWDLRTINMPRCISAVSSSVQQNSQNGDTNIELLQCPSFASDAQILSNFSQRNAEGMGVISSIKHQSETVSEVTCLNKSDKTTDYKTGVSFGSSSDALLQQNFGAISPQLVPVTQYDPLGVFSSSSPISSVPSNNSRTLQHQSWESSYSPFGCTTSTSLFSNGLVFCDHKRFSVTMGHSEAYHAGNDSYGSASSKGSASFCSRHPSPRNEPKNHYAVCGLQRSCTLPDTLSLATSANQNEASLMSPIRTQLSLLTSRFQSFGSGLKTSETSFFGGLHGLKTAANSVASKLGEIKDAISSTTSLPKPFEMEKKLLYDDDPETTVTPIVSSSTESDSRQSSVAIIKKNNQSESKSLSKEMEQCDCSCNFDGIIAKFQLDQSEPVLDREQGFLVRQSPKRVLPVLKRQADRLALEVQMTTCSRCDSCSSLIYDEQIMSTWTAEDSNLNTRCPYCHRKIVPLLMVTITDYRTGGLHPAKSKDSVHSGMGLKKCAAVSSLQNLALEKEILKEQSCSNSSITGFAGCLATRQGTNSEYSLPLKKGGLGSSHIQSQSIGSLPSSASPSTIDVSTDSGCVGSSVTVLEPISVPYLSPIVLRKELETVLEHEGDMCLTKPNFVDEHPIIFWNLVWYCNRINVPTHLHYLCLNSKIINAGREEWKGGLLRNGYHSHVLVKCMWDNPKIYENIGPPMYTNFASNAGLAVEPGLIPKGAVQQIISDISSNNLIGPLKIMLNNLLKKGCVTGSSKCQHHSIYRDLLFLSIVVFGRKNIDLYNFEVKYQQAFDELTTDQFILSRQDYPLSKNAVVCRSYFTALEL